MRLTRFRKKKSLYISNLNSYRLCMSQMNLVISMKFFLDGVDDGYSTEEGRTRSAVNRLLGREYMVRRSL